MAAPIVDIYCRISHDPSESSTSLEGQEEAARNYCRDHGLIVGMVHHEIYSGYYYRERKKLTLMRERYRAGKIQGIVIYVLDRLSRNQTHMAVLMDEMEHHGIIIHCVMEKIDTSAMGKFVIAALALVAEMEREKIMDRTTMGRVNQAKAGRVVSGNKAPYGWLWVYQEDGTKTVELHPEQAPVLRWIAEEYAAGVAATALVAQLQARGIPSPNNIGWSHTTILRLISDERITGKGAKLFAYQRRKTKQPLAPVDLPDGTYPAIISEATFKEITRRRTINKADAIRASKEPEEYLLRAGFVKCAYCHKPMTAVHHRQNYIYRCTHTDMEHTNVILAKQLDVQIWQWVRELADHIELIEQAVALATSSTNIQKDTEAIEHSIAIWKAKAQNYLSDLDDGSLIGDTRAAVRSALNDATKMVLQLETERAQLRAGMVDKERERRAYQEILAWCKQVKGSREELSYQQKRDFLRMLGVMVVVENIKPYYENLRYRVEITLPAIQELLTPERVTCNTSSGEGVGSPLG